MDNRYFFESDKTLKVGDIAVLDKAETAHLSKVRRARVGDEIIGFCGDGLDYVLQIQDLNKISTCKIIKISQNPANEVTPITVFLATLKSDALNEAIDNLTQLNVKNIVIFDSKFSVAHIDQDKINKLKQRAIQASKQSERSDIVKISQIKFSQVIKELKNFDLSLFAYENSNIQFNSNIKKYKGKNIAVIIGCEGGFEAGEVEQLSSVASQISLGKTILRAPVACTALVASVMACLGEWN